MGDNREQTIERVPMDLAPTPVLKVEPPRNSSGAALLRTVPMPTQQARFLATNIQSSPSAATATSSKQSKQASNIQRLEGVPNVSGMPPTAVINRIATMPVPVGTSANYHVPRGAAAVANIAVPRSSLATPIIRGTSTLHTITPTSQPGLIRTVGPTTLGGVRGSSSWLGGGANQPPRHPLNNTFPQNQSRMAVSTRIGPATTVSTRPVLIQATQSQPHKPLQSGTQHMHLTEKKFVPKGSVMPSIRSSFASSAPTTGRLISQPVPRVTPPLRPVVSLHPTAVLVSTPTTLQLQTGAPSVSTRPVSVLTSAMRVTTAPGTGVAVSKVYCQPSEPSVYIQATNKPAQAGSVVNIANSLYSLPANTFYDNSSNLRTFSTTPVTTTAVQPNMRQQAQSQQPNNNQIQGLVTAGQPVRFNPVMVVDPVLHPYVPSESAQTIQSTESCNSATAPLNQMPQVKQNASPRPSILRKRETEGTPGKAAKNLNPLFGTLTVSTPSSPPSPPKRPESRGNGGAPSSGGSTTISATSSPGLGADSPPPLPHPMPTIKQEPEDDRPLEMSPRKKPRKQQLTGNQMKEPKFSDEDMEFIPSQKVKKEKSSKESEGPVKRITKRPVMSLLRTYRPTWKPKHHHFQRYSDVKPREEKRPSISDIASQRNVLQKASGWKIYHLSAQMSDVSEIETDVFDKLTTILKALEKKSGKDGDINRVNELIKGNIQRSKVITDQLQEAKCQVMKIFDHKCHVTEVLNRFSSRRSGKKRERV